MAGLGKTRSHRRALSALIAEDVAKDTRKLDSTDDFAKGLTEDIPGSGFGPGGGGSISLKNFADQRRAYLLNYPGSKNEKSALKVFLTRFICRARGRRHARPLARVVGSVRKSDPLPGGRKSPNRAESYCSRPNHARGSVRHPPLV